MIKNLKEKKRKSKTILFNAVIPGILDGPMTGSSLAGMPAPQKELTDEFNVLEAGLWNSISLNKGTRFLPLSFYLFYFILLLLL